jgi:uncharacterized protein (DUF1501 family)
MTITRRQFLRRSALVAAAVTAPHPLLRAMMRSTAHASPPSDAVLVLIQLEGGNDGLNTVVAIDGAQRALYEQKRPALQVPVESLSATEIDADPEKGNRLALHPSMGALKTLYDAGKVAVVNGVGYDDQSLSHFRSEDIWFGADPNGPYIDGWFGRYLDTAFPGDLVAVDVDSTLNPIFFCNDCNVLAVRRLAEFELPDDEFYPDLAAKKAALQAAYAIEANPLQTSGLQLTVGAGGDVLLSKMDDYAVVNTSWSSNLDGQGGRLARRLKEVASVLRHDAMDPPAPTGARFFHVRIGGFDTHANQGVLTGRQPDLLSLVSEAIKGFYDDIVAFGLSDRLLMVTFSEFGRRVGENGAAGTAGTDHGAAAPLFVVGDPVVGGIHGTVPALDDLLDGRHLKHHTDFRQVYATIIDHWLASPGFHVPLLPGAPFSTLGFIA